MRFAILGGSFNPIHIGHLSLAEAVLNELNYHRVIFIPAFQSPLKAKSEGASTLDRMEMLAAAIAGNPRFTLDNCEIRRRGISYTIDTLADIITRYEPEGKPGLILGNDLVSGFDKWRSHREITEIADIIIAKRLSSDGTVDDTSAFPHPHITLNNDIIDLSSRQLREEISRDGNWQNLVPAGAGAVIRERSLYDYSGAKSTPDEIEPNLILRIENDVRNTLDFDRFIHCRNTALLSWDLCLRYGLDADKGYLAGIAHDLCKELGSEELITVALMDGEKQSKLEKKKPGLLHARAAAVLVERKYGINDKDILDAIRYHTTGGKDMCPLAKIVYIADKIEISRVGVDPDLRKMALSSDLDTLFSAVLDDTVAHLKSRQLDLSYGTKRLLAAMKKRNES